MSAGLGHCAAGFSGGVPPAFPYQTGERPRHWFSDGVRQTLRVCRCGRAEGTGSLEANGTHRFWWPTVSRVWSQCRAGSSRGRQRSNTCPRSGSTGIPSAVVSPPSHRVASPFRETAGGAGRPRLRLGLRRKLLGLRRALGTGTLGNRSQSAGGRCQRPPKPVIVMPWTKNRWAKMKSTRMGASMMVLTANTISQCCTSKSLNILTPTAKGNLSMVLR